MLSGRLLNLMFKNNCDS